jgi:HPt (histidine-containing phosphotransfer) domain-containing protein
MTANVLAEDRQECLAAGMDDFVAKPIRVDDLAVALRKSRPLVGIAGAAAAPEPCAAAADSALSDALLDPAALERLREMAGGDAGFLSEMFSTFLVDAPGLLAQMQGSLERGDTETLRLAAHILKSNSANFGATVLSGLCRDLEMMAKTGGLEGAKAKLASVEAEWARVRAELERQQREEGEQ